MNFKFVVLKSLLFLTLAAPSVGAATVSSASIKGLMINAESMYRDTEKGIVELEGNVQVVFKGHHLSCDRATININKSEVDASGHVLMINEKIQTGGTRIIYDFEKSTGIIYNGYVESGQVIFQGSLINKISENEYITTDTEYTACTTCPPAWSFKGSQIKAELGGYAHIKNSVLKFGGVPIFWLPYLIVPLKSDRQSGLLPPSFESSSKGGIAISESYFWAINKSQDATFTLKNYQFRGLKGLANYRYILSETSSGELDAAILNDKVIAEETHLNNFRSYDSKGTKLRRWFLRYNHYYEMPSDFVQRTQINLASDLQYPKDFNEETKNLGDPAMESRASLTKNSSKNHFNIDSSYYYNLLQANPLAGNSYAVHRLPEITYAQTASHIGNSGYLYSFNLNYVNLARSQFAYDDITTQVDTNGNKTRFVSNDKNVVACDNDPTCNYVRDGKFNTTSVGNDLIRTGQRFDIKPTIYHPIQISNLAEIMPSVSYRETHYSFGAGDEPSNTRRLFRAEILAKTTASRIYGDLDNLKSSRYKHEIQPFMSYTTIPWIQHPSHPFFGASQETSAPFFKQGNLSDSDLNSDLGVQFDYNDRIYDRNVVTAGIVNKLIRKEWNGSSPEYKQVGTLKIYQSYDLFEAQRDDVNKQPYSDLTSILQLRFDNVQSYSTFSFKPYQRVTNVSSSITVNNDLGHYVSLGLTRSYNILPNNEVDYEGRTEDYRLSGGKMSRYLNFMGNFTYDANNDNYDGDAALNRRITSWGYIAQIKPPGKCWSIDFKQYMQTGGDTKFHLDFVFLFDGKNASTLSQKSLEFN